MHGKDIMAHDVLLGCGFMVTSAEMGLLSHLYSPSCWVCSLYFSCWSHSEPGMVMVAVTSKTSFFCRLPPQGLPPASQPTVTSPSLWDLLEVLGQGSRHDLVSCSLPSCHFGLSDLR